MTNTDTKKELEKSLDQLILCKTKNDHSFRDSCITKQQFMNRLDQYATTLAERKVREARKETLKSILVAYMQTTGKEKDLFIDWLEDKILLLSENPLESLVLPLPSTGHTDEQMKAAVREARKKAYSRGFDTAKTVYLKRIDTLKEKNNG